MSEGKNNSRGQFVTPDLGFTPKGLYIGGEWLESVKGKRFESINPANMEILGDVPLADEHDVNLAVMAAKDAFNDWRRMPIKERAGYLVALADKLQDNRDELGLMDCLDSGNTIAGMKGDVEKEEHKMTISNEKFMSLLGPQKYDIESGMRQVIKSLVPFKETIKTYKDSFISV